MDTSKLLPLLVGIVIGYYVLPRIMAATMAGE